MVNNKKGSINKDTPAANDDSQEICFYMVDKGVNQIFSGTMPIEAVEQICEDFDHFSYEEAELLLLTGMNAFYSASRDGRETIAPALLSALALFMERTTGYDMVPAMPYGAHCLVVWYPPSREGRLLSAFVHPQDPAGVLLEEDDLMELLEIVEAIDRENNPEWFEPVDG